MAVDKNGKELPKGITQRPDGRYMGRFEYKGEKFTLYDKDLRILKKKLADLRYEVEHGLYAKTEDITVKSWFTTWIEEYKSNNSKEGTLVTYKDCFRCYIESRLGKKKLKDIRSEQIQKLYNDMHKEGYSNSTIGLVNIILNSMYKQAIKNEIVLKNPVKLTTLPKNKEDNEKRVLTKEEQGTFIDYAESSPYFNIYKISLLTGLRVGEVAALDWEDINFKDSTLNVRHTLKRTKEKGYFKDIPKSASSKRSIPMLDEVAQIFRRHKVEQGKLKLLLGERWEPVAGLNNLVFTSKYGKPLYKDTLNNNLSKVVDHINIEEANQAKKEKREPIIFDNITPHTLRHTFATRCIENGMTPQVLKAILGHSSLSMTMDLYAHVLPDAKAEEIKKIANIL